MNDFIDEGFQTGYTGFPSDRLQAAGLPAQVNTIFDPYWAFQYGPPLPSFDFQDDEFFTDTLMTSPLTSTTEFEPTQSDNSTHQAGTGRQLAHNSSSRQVLGIGSSWVSNDGRGSKISSANYTYLTPIAVDGLASGSSGISTPSHAPQAADQIHLRSSGNRRLNTGEQTSGTSASSTQTEDNVTGYICHDCKDRPTFSHMYLYNKHRKKHDRLHGCLATNCAQAFAFPRDLDRHIASKHAELLSNSRKLHFCAHQNCDRAVNGRRGGFPRKDTLVRHLRTHKTIHPDQQTGTSSSSTTNGSPFGNSSTENL